MSDTLSRRFRSNGTESSGFAPSLRSEIVALACMVPSPGSTRQSMSYAVATRSLAGFAVSDSTMVTELTKSKDIAAATGTAFRHASLPARSLTEYWSDGVMGPSIPMLCYSITLAALFAAFIVFESSMAIIMGPMLAGATARS